MSHLDIDELTTRASELETNGAFTAAMHIRERLLLLLQPTHGDPSPQTDQQKLLLCKLVLKVVDTRDNRVSQGKPSVSKENVGGASRTRGGAEKASSPHPHYAPKNNAQALLTESLSTHGLLAFAERLLSAGNTLPETQEDPDVMDTRAKLLLGIGQVLHRQGRPRAAIPLMQRAIVQLRRVSEGAPTLDIASAHLALCALHSAASHHREALLEVHQALGIVLQVEDALWQNDPAAQPQSPQTDEDENGQAAKVEDDANPLSPGSSSNYAAPNGSYMSNTNSTTHTAAPHHGDGDDEDPAANDVPTVGPRTKIYYGGFQAACYHNLATEQEHLGFYELALESCQTGFELSYLTHGANHPLSQRLKKIYAELFTSLHYKHFSTTKKSQISKVFDDPEAAVAQLNNTYKQSLKHRQALLRESAEQESILNKTAHNMTTTTLPIGQASTSQLSRTQKVLSGKLRPSNVNRSSSSSVPRRGRQSRPHSAMAGARRSSKQQPLHHSRHNESAAQHYGTAAHQPINGSTNEYYYDDLPPRPASAAAGSRPRSALKR